MNESAATDNTTNTGTGAAKPADTCPVFVDDSPGLGNTLFIADNLVVKPDGFAQATVEKTPFDTYAGALCQDIMSLKDAGTCHLVPSILRRVQSLGAAACDLQLDAPQQDRPGNADMLGEAGRSVNHAQRTVPAAAQMGVDTEQVDRLMGIIGLYKDVLQEVEWFPGMVRRNLSIKEGKLATIVTTGVKNVKPLLAKNPWLERILDGALVWLGIKPARMKATILDHKKLEEKLLGGTGGAGHPPATGGTPAGTHPGGTTPGGTTPGGTTATPATGGTSPGMTPAPVPPSPPAGPLPRPRRGGPRRPKQG